MANPLVSVVLPAYNEEDCIKVAIESIISQHYQDWELIVVDNNSVDRTAEIAASTGDPRVRVVSERSPGIVEALNRGVRESRGLYIARLDADDTSDVERINAQAEFLNSHPSISLLGSQAWLKIEGDSRLRRLRVPCSHILINALKYFRNPFVHSSVMFHRSAFESVGGYRDLCEWQDYDLWIRMLSRYRAANLPKYLVTRLIRKNSTWRIPRRQSIGHDQHVLLANRSLLRSRIGMAAGRGYHEIRKFVGDS